MVADPGKYKRVAKHFIYRQEISRRFASGERIASVTQTAWFERIRCQPETTVDLFDSIRKPFMDHIIDDYPEV